jgi:F-type H+-transporting ATPase subunit b
MDLLNQLNIDPRAILVNIVGFLALWFILRRLVFAPIGRLLAERQEDINRTYDQMEADRRHMESLRADYERRLAQIEAEAREKIQGAIKDAQAARDQIVSEANGRAREMIGRAEEEIAREREQALITLRQQVVDLALGAATKIIGDNLDAARQRRLIDDFIASGAAADRSAPVASGNGAGSPPPAGPGLR